MSLSTRWKITYVYISKEQNTGAVVITNEAFFITSVELTSSRVSLG
jgi:hypothetical protein